MVKPKFVSIIAATVVIVIIILVGIFSVFLDTNNNVKGKPMAIDTYATEKSVDLLSMAMNDFSFEMHKQLSSDNSENIFYSPYSIFVALSMAYEGANGETADEMRNILGMPQRNETILCSFGKIYNLLNQEKEYTLGTGNALWIKDDYPFLVEYLSFIENYYMGESTDVDFTNPDEVAKLINNWVEEKTFGKIKDLVSGSDIHPLTTMILTNAVYFKGSWLFGFPEQDTFEDDFRVSSDKSVKVPMMCLYGSDAVFNYTETEDMQVLELPYKGDDVSMVIILPKNHDMTRIEEELNNENLEEWLGSMSEQNVNVYLPKFKLETDYSLRLYLQNMGMNIPFSLDADFSGMTGYKELYIEKVLHKAFIDVNEEGTEAAAATSVHMVLKSAPTQEINFIADHPFIFLIKHNLAGNILFMGKVINPSY